MPPSLTWILKPIMSGSLHYARTQKQETPGVVKTFPHFLGGPPPTWDAILVQSFGKPSPGSSAITLVPCMAFITLPPMGRWYLWGSHGQGSSDQTRQCRHHQVLLRRTKLELSKGPCEKPCVETIASFPVTRAAWASCELKEKGTKTGSVLLCCWVLTAENM